MNCKSCEAHLTRTDRFCPACGTPNAAAKFHPGLDYGRDEPDPFDAEAVAQHGEPACPRCHRAIRRADGFCRACGMDLARAWKHLDRPATLGVWTTPGPHNLDPYRSLGSISVMLRTVLVMAVVTTAAVGVANFWLYTRVSGERAIPGPTGDSLRNLITTGHQLAVGLAVLTAVLLVLWMNRAYRNLPALGVNGQRFGAGWVIGAWLVPGLNLLRPKQLVDELWKASDPSAPPLSSGWRAAASPEWSGVWWALLLLGMPLAAAGQALMPASLVPPSADLGAALFLDGFAGLVFAGSALCLLVLVARITGRQEVRAEVLGEPDVGPRGRKREAEPVAKEAGPALVKSVSRASGVFGKY